MSNPLLRIIQQMIATTGPLTIAEYMQLCHAHPQYGYYATQKPIGAKGDFITAPEVSQIFGELIGIWCVQAWRSIGKPKQFQIVELGPGNGTLMNDILRTVKNSFQFFAACEVILVENSKTLKRIQQEKLSEFSDKTRHVESVEAIASKPAIFVANEFFDAIPFRQFIKTKPLKSNDTWLEACVGMDENQRLNFVTTQPKLDSSSLPKRHEQQPIGAVLEIAPTREAITAQIAAHIATHAGAGLFIDYGHTKSGFGDTFQSVHKHQYVSPLDDPGKCDLTSHVDFDALATAAISAGAKPFSAISQGQFLLQMGLLERAGALGANKSIKQQSQIQNDVERLAGPNQMGELFKVLCIANSDEPIPPFTD